MSSFRLAFGLLSLGLLTACQQEAPAPASTSSAESSPSTPQVVEPAVLVASGNTGLLPASQGNFVAIDVALLQSAKRAPCSLDRLNSQPAAASPIRIPASGALEGTGWLVNLRKESPQSLALLLQNDEGTYAALGQGGLNRQDVAKALKAPSASMAGFRLDARIGTEVKAGNYQVLLAQDTGGAITVCTTSYAVSIDAG